MKNFIKDPDAKLDYSIDWSDWLETGESISSHTVTVESGITEDANSESDGIVTVWVSGGTVGEDYDVAVKITTDAGRIDERTISITIANR